MPASNKIATAIALIALAVPLSACGGSDKPAYCDDKAALQADVKSLTNLDLSSAGLSELKSTLQKAQTDAKALVSSAKKDFPAETAAMSSAINTVKSSIDGLSGSPSAQELLVLAPSVSSAVKSVDAFMTATKDKC